MTAIYKSPGEKLDELMAGMPTLEKLLNEYCIIIYDKCDGNLSQAARLLGVSRNTLYNRLRSEGRIR